MSGGHFCSRGKLDEENANRSVSWLINSKAIGPQAVLGRLLLARDADTPEAQRLLDELNTTRLELARLSTDIPPRGDEDNWKQRRQELAEKEQRLIAQLSQGNQRSLRDDPWIDLDEVIRRLPRSGIFVDFARFPVRNFTARGDVKAWKAARYVAWISSRDGGLQVIDLGDAEEIDRLIEKVQKALAAAPKQIPEEGERQAEQALRDQLEKLSQRLLEPLRKHLDDVEQWLLSPDDNLWLVPWAALPLPEKSYVIEKLTLQLLISRRDLVLNPLRLDRKTTTPVILADPDFDLGREELPRRSRQAAKMPEVLVQRSMSAGLRLGKVPRLPGKASEAKAVTPALQKWLSLRPEVYTGEEAVASRLRSVHSPHVLMLSTHGFFLPERKPLNGAANEESRPDELQNPLLRCGLLLAGCNNAGATAAGEETGVLIGVDVVSTDLRGTELVVLSACETGLGEVRNGEGVAGLRQAFQLAGARSVVSTLWQIPDRESAQLMSGFFDQLGKGKAEALREAQLSLIQAYRKRYDAAHPFFWAAFTLTGQ